MGLGKRVTTYALWSIFTALKSSVLPRFTPPLPSLPPDFLQILPSVSFAGSEHDPVGRLVFSPRSPWRCSLVGHVQDSGTSQ